MIKPVTVNGKKKWRVVSHTGKNLGTCNTRKEAEDRLREVEYFKHKKGK